MPSCPPATACPLQWYLPGQFDQRADSAAECIQLISVRASARCALPASICWKAPDRRAGVEIKKYVINPVEAREASLDTKQTLKMEYPVPAPVKVLEGFNQLDEEQLKSSLRDNGLAMDLAISSSARSISARAPRPPSPRSR